MIFRRATLPADVRQALDLAAGDKVLASAELDDGWAVASRQHLHLTGARAVRRPWSAVDRASADPETSTITVTWVDAEPTALRLVGGSPGPFPTVLRERVQTSVVLAERITLPGGAARVAVRRAPDGSLFSQVSVDGGVDVDDPAIRRRLDVTESAVRSACGMGL
ncbi:hypothetical protein SAMN04489860_1485 [Paraoerskovia marina]|uniref:Uncharacterized protein n=1 Tax=Paraoerskovia marina TaxID=545619 RepID=A0A1H1RZ25_9CELL|nr:hypothetical protein [Paraoerskovia marina]SDS40895.1 hypothetical protein SAMN04489860_1485 [Paraoerskovia marina]